MNNNQPLQYIYMFKTESILYNSQYIFHHYNMML